MRSSSRFPKATASSMSTISTRYNPWLCCFRSRNQRLMEYYRQAAAPNPNPIVKRKDGKKTLLTSQQRVSVVRTWHKLSSDIAALGICSQNKLFELDRETKRLFRFHDDKENDDLQRHPRFRKHAFWMVQALNAVVENLDQLDTGVAEMMVEIGEKHAGIPHFYISFFTILPEMYNLVWEDQLKERYSANVHKSWEKIFNYIVELLVEGYETKAPLFCQEFSDSTSLRSTRASYFDSLSDNTPSDSDITQRSGRQKSSSYTRKRLLKTVGEMDETPSWTPAAEPDRAGSEHPTVSFNTSRAKESASLANSSRKQSEASDDSDDIAGS